LVPVQQQRRRLLWLSRLQVLQPARRSVQVAQQAWRAQRPVPQV
jgi:hypothetical protein